MARVVVVGAGMAGLTAALRLHQSDHDVIVLESRDRVGGRVLSVTLSNGEVAELGGEWLTEDQHFVTDLAQELDIPLSEVGVDFAERDLIGAPPIPEEEHRRVAENVATGIGALPAVERSQMTADAVLDGFDDGSDAFAVLRQRLEGSAGVRLAVVGVDEIIGIFGVGGSRYLRVEGGNQLLADAIANTLEDVRLGTPVAEIDTNGPNVIIRCNGQDEVADAVVIAVPLPLIPKLEFTPPLSGRFTAALETLVMGTAAKLAAPTAKEPPLVAKQDGQETWWCWTGADTDKGARQVVTAFAGTQTAINVVKPNWIDQIADALPEVDLIDTPTKVDWGQEVWSQGCYSALGPGDEELLGVFEEQGRVVFAGEHTLGAGSIDGAIESGELAAARLMDYLA